MKNISILLLLLLASASAEAKRKSGSDGSERSVEVDALEQSASAGEGSFAYALPRTLLRVKVVVERRKFVRGAYADFAEKYLAIAGVERSSRERYVIRSINVTPVQEADPAHIYIAKPSDGSVPAQFFAMQASGLAVSLPFNAGGATAVSPADGGSDWGQPHFTDMGCEVTAYRPITPKVPLPADTAGAGGSEAAPSAVVPFAPPASKDKDAQAFEAAKTLTQIRKRRLELITADVESVFANTASFQIALNEIKKIERQYLELFIGTTLRSEAEYCYDILPVNGKDDYPLFVFSADSGVDGEAGEEVTLHVQCSDAFAPLPRPHNSGYRYRIPCASALQILHGENELFHGRYLIYQYGKLVNILGGS